ncbi:MAG TPA: pyridoxamine 5'-phosphate oxidase family protein [Propionibacteriaceae bacterium]|nr:pyridoxamine 5'-phosphate oxidase family protein [Propionibacteriaceae bacterium]
MDRSTLAHTVPNIDGGYQQISSESGPKMSHSENPTSATPSPTQAASDAFWAAFARESGLIELDRQECLDLLAAKSVGRIAYAVDKGARILPVNYILSNDAIIFRTIPDAEISHHALEAMCAFEVDETDEFFQAGWSVVAVGRLELATEEDFASMRYGKLPEPWAGGDRWMFLRLPCDQVSGRRVIGHGG